MPYYEIKNAKWEIKDQDGNIIGETVVQDVVLDFKTPPTEQQKPSKMTRIGPIGVSWTVGMSSHEFRALTHLLGLSPLWNGWMHLLRWVMGKN
jgi:hypothetical protein